MTTPNLKTAIVCAMTAPGGFTRASARTVDDNGVPRQKFVKELIRDGEFTKGEQKFRVTPEIRQHWEATHRKFVGAGNSVGVPTSHEAWHKQDSDENRGFVRELFNEGDSLYGVIELIGDDAISAASRSNVSIYAQPKFKDGNGTEYDWPIRHAALTDQGVIPGLGEFIPIAASHDSTPAQVPVFTLSTENPTMSIDLKKLGEKLGIEDELTEKNAIDAISLAFDNAGKAKADAIKAKDAKIKSLEEQVKANQPIELSHSERGLAKRLVNEKLDGLVKDGKIIPAVREALAPLVTGSDLMLSFGDNTDSTGLQIVEALQQNDIVKLGEQTGRQVVELSHPTTSEKSADPDLAERQKRARKMAGIKDPE